ncbi:MAG: hypothetical protein NTU51_01215 [Bacteroidetes bacterium]|nr:hypothetical protein [Bacteroidota bacterium]
MRNGAAYFVKGVGGEVNLDKVAEVGGNSIRLWGVENAGKVLDEAQKNGLTVMLGLWLQTERQGFDYNDSAKVQKQFNYYKTIIEKYKHHPALLFWGIGNELDLQYNNTRVWNAVQDIAKYIHQTDPDHPTSTVTAGIDSVKVQLITKMCPDIDIFCINTYGDIGSVPKSIGKFGWKGPWMITEWGPNGYWESPKTSWDVSIEQTSSEKKRVYYERYTKYIGPYKNKCLGSYAFFWGGKQEYTETWFGLFSKDNLPTESIDALEIAFTGHNPAKPAPTILSMTIQGKLTSDNIKLKAGEKYAASVSARIGLNMNDTVADSLNKFVYRWKVLTESTDKRSGGDAEQEAREVQGLISHARKAQIKFRAPDASGPYRLFVTVYYNGKVAYANIPFWVDSRSEKDGQARFIEFKKTNMDSFNQ